MGIYFYIKKLKFNFLDFLTRNRKKAPIKRYIIDYFLISYARKTEKHKEIRILCNIALKPDKIAGFPHKTDKKRINKDYPI